MCVVCVVCVCECVPLLAPCRLGFFYSPFLPFVVLVTSFVLFYVKKVLVPTVDNIHDLYMY